MPAGIPSELTESKLDELLSALSTGDSMAKISQRIGVSVTTIWRMCEADKELDEKYTRAKQQKAQYLAEQIIDIADDPELKPDDKRIRVDARKWVAGKYYGKLFGDKIMTEHSGTIGTTDLSDEELTRRLAELEQARANSER